MSQIQHAEELEGTTRVLGLAKNLTGE